MRSGLYSLAIVKYPVTYLGHNERTEQPAQTGRLVGPRAHFGAVDVKVDLVERLLDRGALADDIGTPSRDKQPGRCCVTGCDTPEEAAQPLTKVRS